MSQHETTYDYGEMGRDYWIAERGAIGWDLIAMNFNELRRFLTTLEEFIEKGELREVTEIEREHGSRVDWAEHHPYHWQDIIGTQLRQSYIVSLMSATEWHLKSVFQDVGMILGMRLPSFRNMHKFLKDTANFSKPSGDTWDFFDDLRELRNVVVHRAGFVDGDKYKDKVKGFVEATPDLELDSGFVKVTAVFCRSAHDRIERFFEELHEEYVELCRRLEVVR